MAGGDGAHTTAQECSVSSTPPAMSASPWIALAVFVLCYVFFVLLPSRRAWVACGGGMVLLLVVVMFLV
jgi:hypothetical protein